MERRMPLPDGGPRDLPARQQTLYATIAWSYELLSDRGRRLLRWLSAFAGGATLAAVEVVCEPLGDGAVGVIEDIRTLVDNSLLRLEEQDDGEARYWMLQTIRDFALEQLEASPDAATARQRHAEHFVALAEEGERRLRTPDQRAWLTRLERDHDNFRAALTWTQTESGAPSLGLRLTGALSRFWWLHGHVTEGRIWLAACLARGDPLDTSRLKALVGAGRLAWNQGDYEQANAFSEAASVAARATGDKFQEAEALSDLLALARTRGDVDKAMELCESSLALYREVGHTWGICIALYWLGFMARGRGDFNLAISFQEESLTLRRAAGDVWGVSWSLHDLGLVALAQGDYARAAALLEEGLRLQQELGHRRGVAWSLHDLGRLAMAVGELERAATLLSESMLLRREHSDKLGVAECLESFAALAGALAQPERAATLFGAAEALRNALAAPLWPTDRARHDRNVAAVRTQLDSHALGKAWARGLGLTLEDASTYALAQIAPLPPAGSEPRAIGEPLSLREREVVQLLAQRRTNRQIAEVLVISERTAENHVSRILGKLGVESRAQAAVWAVEQGLGTRRSD
jgi:non-specific serine/threonine protein kinase